MVNPIKINGTNTEEYFLIFRTFLYSVIGVIIILGNICVILILPKVRSYSERATKVFLYSLTLADLLTGILLCVPKVITSAIDKWPFGDVLCTMSAYGRIFLHVGALLSLLAVTIDRYLAIAYPLRYPTFMTCKAAIRATLVLWLISALFGCIYGPILGRPSAYFPLYSSCAFASSDPDATDYSVIICFIAFTIAPFVTTIVLYMRIYRIVNQHQKFKVGQLASHHNPSIRNLKFMKTFTIVVFFFAVTWIPSVMIHYIEELSTIVISNQYTTFVVEMLILCNSGVNVFIYFWRNREFRGVAMEKLGSKCRRENDRSTKSHTSITT